MSGGSENGGPGPPASEVVISVSAPIRLLDGLSTPIRLFFHAASIQHSTRGAPNNPRRLRRWMGRTSSAAKASPSRLRHHPHTEYARPRRPGRDRHALTDRPRSPTEVARRTGLSTQPTRFRRDRGEARSRSRPRGPRPSRRCQPDSRSEAVPARALCGRAETSSRPKVQCSRSTKVEVISHRYPRYQVHAREERFRIRRTRLIGSRTIDRHC